MGFFSKLNIFKKKEVPAEGATGTVSEKALSLVLGALTPEIMELYSDSTEIIMEAVMKITAGLLRKNIHVRIDTTSLSYTLHPKEVQRVFLTRVADEISEDERIIYHRMDVVQNSFTDPNMLEVLRINPHDFLRIYMIVDGEEINISSLVADCSTFGIVSGVYKEIRAKQSDVPDTIDNVIQLSTHRNRK